MVEWAARATGEGADLLLLPRARDHGLPARGPRAAARVRPRQPSGARRARRRDGRRMRRGRRVRGRSSAGSLHNAAALLRGGAVAARYHKCRLPNYGVFDEQRYFAPGSAGVTIEVAGTRIGLSVCEDAWFPGPPFDELRGRRAGRRTSTARRSTAGRRTSARTCCRDRAAETGAWIVYVNTVGGQDELVFDGGSLVMAPDGTVAARALRVRRGPVGGGPRRRSPARARRRTVHPGPTGPKRSTGRWCWARATTCARTGSREVVLGLSGGIDSALVRRGGRRRAGPRSRPRARDALDVLEPREPRGRRDRGPASWGSAWTRCRSPTCFAPTKTQLRGLGAVDRGLADENLQATDPRQPPDGAVEQVRLAGARHREQERVRGGLLHALRRHGRRVRADQGRPEDPGVRAVRLAERAGGRARRDATDPRARADEAAVGRAPAGAEGHRLAARPTTCSTRSSRPTSRTISAPTRSSQRASADAETVARVVR